MKNHILVPIDYICFVPLDFDMLYDDVYFVYDVIYNMRNSLYKPSEEKVGELFLVMTRIIELLEEYYQ